MPLTHAINNQSISLYDVRQQGYVLLSVLLILMIGGILLFDTMRTTFFTTQTAYHALEYGRAMAAAEGGVMFAKQEITDGTVRRRFADSVASEGVFSRNETRTKWWADTEFAMQHTMEDDIFDGVAIAPQYTVEQIGEYVADGGTGIVNLDVGGASYGRTSATGREHILFKVQAYGVGSQKTMPRVIEATVITKK